MTASPPLTKEIKRKILGENAARLRNIDLDALRRILEDESLTGLRLDADRHARNLQRAPRVVQPSQRVTRSQVATLTRGRPYGPPDDRCTE